MLALTQSAQNLWVSEQAEFGAAFESVENIAKNSQKRVTRRKLAHSNNFSRFR
jgi:hypothetical protein